jgi:hypothetical protein
MFARQLIGGAVKLPFIWTLLGIFGGMETFGLLGLFLGPTLLAILMSIWRDWVTDLNKSETAAWVENAEIDMPQEVTTETEQIPPSSSTEFDDGQ